MSKVSGFQKAYYFHKKSIILTYTHTETHFKIEQLCNLTSVPMATFKQTASFLDETRIYSDIPKIFYLGLFLKLNQLNIL